MAVSSSDARELSTSRMESIDLVGIKKQRTLPFWSLADGNPKDAQNRMPPRHRDTSTAPVAVMSSEEISSSGGTVAFRDLELQSQVVVPPAYWSFKLETLAELRGGSMPEYVIQKPIGHQQGYKATVHFSPLTFHSGPSATTAHDAKELAACCAFVSMKNAASSPSAIRYSPAAVVSAPSKQLIPVMSSAPMKPSNSLKVSASSKPMTPGMRFVPTQPAASRKTEQRCQAPPASHPNPTRSARKPFFAYCQTLSLFLQRYQKTNPVWKDTRSPAFGCKSFLTWSGCRHGREFSGDAESYPVMREAREASAKQALYWLVELPETHASGLRATLAAKRPVEVGANRNENTYNSEKRPVDIGASRSENLYNGAAWQRPGNLRNTWRPQDEPRRTRRSTPPKVRLPQITASSQYGRLSPASPAVGGQLPVTGSKRSAEDPQITQDPRKKMRVDAGPTAPASTSTPSATAGRLKRPTTELVDGRFGF